MRAFFVRAGFAIAAAGGVALGSLLSLSRTVERSVYPLTLLFQMVPLIAIAPLLVIWCGNGRPAIVAATARRAISIREERARRAERRAADAERLAELGCRALPVTSVAAVEKGAP